MTSQNVKQAILVSIVPDMLKRQGNQTMKRGTSIDNVDLDF